MNSNAKVTKVLREPYFKGSNWWVDVEVDVKGETQNKEIACLSKRKADSIQVGYILNVKSYE